MADLDDFFAKKDKKKSKGGKKFTTTEELAKKLEETHRREKEKLKEKKTLSSQNVDGDGELGGERKVSELQFGAHMDFTFRPYWMNFPIFPHESPFFVI